MRWQNNAQAKSLETLDSTLDIGLQPMYHRSPHRDPNFRTHEKITLIVVHQTAGSTNIGGTLSWFEKQQAKPKDNVSSPYVISAEANPQVVKVVQDTSRAWHAGGPGQTWWGEADVNNFSIGIELSHKAKTPWPDAQIGPLMGLLEMLLNAYPSIKRHRIVGHTDVLLIDRDCPGLEFDWAALEKFGLGIVPDGGAMSLEYGERQSDPRITDRPSGHRLFCAARWKFRRAHQTPLAKNRCSGRGRLECRCHGTSIVRVRPFTD